MRRRMPRLLPLAAALAALGPALAAPASPGPLPGGPAGPGGPGALEELYAWVTPDPAWHWVEVHLDAPGRLTAEADVVPRSAASVGAGLWLLDASGAVLRRSVDAAWSRDFLQAHATALFITAVDVVQARGPPSPAVRLDAVLDAGTYRVVAVLGGDAPDPGGEVRLSADAPARVGASANGGGVAFAREFDLDAVAAVGLSVPARHAVEPLEVRVVNQASTGLNAEHSVFGAFAGRANLALDMALVTPEGVQNGQRFYPLDHAGPGAFQFLLRTFVDAAPPGCDQLGCERSGVWLLAADVAL